MFIAHGKSHCDAGVLQSLNLSAVQPNVMKVKELQRLRMDKQVDMCYEQSSSLAHKLKSAYESEYATTKVHS